MVPMSPRSSGLQTAFDVAVAPKTAFRRLRDVPTWGWAFLLSSGLAMIAAFAMSPIIAHVLAIELPARLAGTAQIAQLPAAQRDTLIAQQVGFAQTAVHFSFISAPFGIAGGCALQALIMLIANAIGKGDGTFKRFWALAVNASIIGTGISSIALMAIVLLRGSSGFASSAQIASALPGVGTLVPAGAKAAGAFLGALNVFTIWNMVLLAIGMPIVARLSRGVAVTTTLIMLLGVGLFPLVGALIQK